MKFKLKVTVFFALLSIMAAGILVHIAEVRERNNRKETLKARLDSYADIVASADSVSQVSSFLPENMRITVLGLDGDVHYDTYETSGVLENHLQRPEIKDCLAEGTGYAVRFSVTEDQMCQLKHQMTNNIAHELKTPVSSIRGYMETLTEHPDLPADKRQYFIDRTYRQSLRLSELINDIGLITKIEEAPDQFSFEHLDLCILVDEIFEELNPKLVENRITVVNMMQSPSFMNGNRNLLYALFRNLVENSIKYAGPDTVIHLCSFRENGQIHVEYYDTGKGVSVECTDRIFDRFYRIPGSQGEGSGLGLSIVRNAVLFHKGSVEASNRPGAGLQFDIRL